MSNIDLSQLVGGKSYIVLCYIFNNRSKVSSFALADTRANTFTLIDTRCANRVSQFLSISFKSLPALIHVCGFNRASTLPIISILQIHIYIDRHRFQQLI